MNAPLTHLQKLEAEFIHIFREVAAECERPVFLYSIGKDSAVLLHLAIKAFYPSKPPFPLLHVDTTWKFREMIEFRDRRVRAGPGAAGPHQRGRGEGGRQSVRFGLAAAYRRDEDAGAEAGAGQIRVRRGLWRRAARRGKSRAKERVFSLRSPEHRWDPKNQRPEPWRLYNTRKRPGESFRVFPLSNWTESDVWDYIAREDIPSFRFISRRSGRWCGATAR